MVTTDDELYTEDTEIPKAMEEVKSDRHPQTRKILYITKELQTNLTVVSHIQVIRTYDPKPTEPTDRNHDYRSASWIQTRKGSVLSPVLFNIYTNDQPIHKDTRSFIYADDLCIATQDASFEKTESTLSAALDSIGDYYEKNHLRANPDKTQPCVFHLRNRKANRHLNISRCGKKQEYTPSPIYLGVTLDRTLKLQHSHHESEGEDCSKKQRPEEAC